MTVGFILFYFWFYEELSFLKTPIYAVKFIYTQPNMFLYGYYVALKNAKLLSFWGLLF